MPDKAKAKKNVGVGPVGVKIVGGESKWLIHGSIAFGVDGFEVYEPEAAVVRNIFRWYVIGDESKKPLTIHETTHKLSAAGIPTPVESQGRTIPRKRAAGLWNHTTVFRIVTNETYAGIHHYGKMGTQKKSASRKPRSKNETIVIAVPGIVDRSLWEAAQ